MKVCPICKSATITGERKICSSCLKIYQRIYRKRKAVEYLGGKCEQCGRTDLVSLTFHHINPHLKSYNISDWIIEKTGHKMSWETVKQELDKCQVLCFNCHKREHDHGHELKEFLPYLNKRQRRFLEEEFLTDEDLFQFWDNETVLADLVMNRSEAEESIRAKNSNCLFCGEPSKEYFCSDYCIKEAEREATENDHAELFQYWIKNGYQMTGAKYHLKKEQINNRLGLLTTLGGD